MNRSPENPTFPLWLGPLFTVVLLALASCTGSVEDLLSEREAPQATTPTETDKSEITEELAAPTTFLVFGDAADCRGRDAEVAAKVSEDASDILFLGDAAYPDGSKNNFDSCFLPLYGQQVGRFHAIPGDNDYKTADALEFFSVFGAGAGDPDEGWFSFEASGWQIIGLNANCEFVGGCDEASPQYAWLDSVLNESPGLCRLSLSSLPRFTSSANYDGIPRLGPMYQLLHEAGSDIFFAGNSHHYERFERLDPAGNPDPAGIANITIGTGGAPLTQFATEPRVGSLVRNNDSFGFLRITLSPGHYEFNFVTANDDGGLADSGSGDCTNSGE